MPKRRPKTRPCPSCGLAFRKGRIVLRITVSGASRQRVCKRCADLAVPVLAADAPQLCETCNRNRATFCAPCVGELLSKRGDEAIAKLCGLLGHVDLGDGGES